MAKKTPPGAVKRKIAVKETTKGTGAWVGDDRHSGKFTGNKNSGKVKGTRIEKKRG